MKAKKAAVKVKPVQAPAAEDRSAFNCPACAGEGLKDQYHLCEQCQGTGKV